MRLLQTSDAPPAAGFVVPPGRRHNWRSRAPDTRPGKAED